jgi:hypothetical protein
MSELPEELFRRWVHVREEDEGDVRVYRPADSDIPPARGRRAIEFRHGDEPLVYGPGAADRPTASPGSWEDVEIVSVEPDRLRLRWRGG